MNALIQLINTVSRYLRKENIPHAVVGGICVAIWGRPRATEDVDLLIDIDETQLPALCDHLKEHNIRIDLEKARKAVRDGTSFPLYDSWSIHWVDARVPTRPIDRITLERATTIELAEEPVSIATPEDVILSKLMGSKSQDLLDARSIVLRRDGDLDLEYLQNRVRELKMEAQWEKVRPEIV